MNYPFTSRYRGDRNNPPDFTPSVLNAFSIDLEEYFQVTAFDSIFSRAEWNHIPSRVVASTHKLLALLDENGVRATFFVVGWIAERYPQLIRQIDAAGHEIGTHSYWHRLIYQMDRDDFRADLRQSIDVLQNIIGRPIESFRAPTFSITEKSLWALDILSEEGIRFDSSIFPTRHDRYGIPNAERKIHPIETASGIIWEFPLPVARFCGLTVPASGGGYFRIYPYALSRNLIRQINRQGQPVMFYFHPWELDPGQPVVGGTGYFTRKRHRINLAATTSRLKRLMHDFQFSTMRDVIQSYAFVHQPARVPVARYAAVATHV